MHCLHISVEIDYLIFLYNQTPSSDSFIEVTVRNYFRQFNFDMHIFGVDIIISHITWTADVNFMSLKFWYYFEWRIYLSCSVERCCKYYCELHSEPFNESLHDTFQVFINCSIGSATASDYIVTLCIKHSENIGRNRRTLLKGQLYKYVTIQ